MGPTCRLTAAVALALIGIGLSTNQLDPNPPGSERVVLASASEVCPDEDCSQASADSLGGGSHSSEDRLRAMRDRIAKPTPARQKDMGASSNSGSADEMFRALADGKPSKPQPTGKIRALWHVKHTDQTLQVRGSQKRTTMSAPLSPTR
jgi:hypothetical protein